MGGDRGDAQGHDGIPPLDSATDNGDDGERWVRRIVGVSSGSGGDGICRDPPHRIIHKECSIPCILDITIGISLLVNRCKVDI